MNILNTVCLCFSLQIQPPLIRSRYYVRNAKTDVCDSPPEIPYWWRKCVLNPDRSADWLTEQCWIISSTIIQCCVVQKSNADNLSCPSSEMFRLSVQSVCPMFNAGSMLHCLNKANLQNRPEMCRKLLNPTKTNIPGTAILEHVNTIIMVKCTEPEILYEYHWPEVPATVYSC